MAALELGYLGNRKKGQTHAEAKKNAIAAAVTTTLEATFDFSSYNKPRILTTPVGRVGGQFYSFPYMMSSLMIRKSAVSIRDSSLDPEAKKAARSVLFGTAFNLFLYVGLTGLPLFGLATTLSSLLLAVFGDDEEEEGGLSYVDEDGNIKATYDVNWWFRNVWIPEFLGPGGTVQNLFGYDDDTAAVVARSVEMGPISAITDVNFSNSMALNFMFFVPEEPRARTPEGIVGEFLVNLLGGAAVSGAIDSYKAVQEFMNGYTLRGLEKLPRLIASPAKAYRFATEGQTNHDRELVGMDAEFWSSDKAIIQALGWGSTEAAQRQRQNFEGRTIDAQVERARNTMLDKIRKVALDQYQYGNTPETAAAHREVVQEWDEFNRTYPTDVIGVDTFYQVQANAVDKALKSRAARGVPFDDQEKTPYLRGILAERVRAEQE
jgi:hypothetical protein